MNFICLVVAGIDYFAPKMQAKGAVVEKVLQHANISTSMSTETREALQKANEFTDGTDDDRCTRFYKCQSRQDLGGECDRVDVPIYIDSSVHSDWEYHLEKAISIINLAAPGLNLVWHGLPTTRRRAPVSSQATLASATCTLQQ